MIGKILLLLAIAAAGIAYYSFQVEYGETVKCKSGSVRGIIRISRDGRKYQSWLGVPYARPPVGDLRFTDPQPVLPWDGVRDGSSFGPWCAQTSMFTGYSTGQEDCLYLNINTPKLGDKAVKDQKKLPVIVYIHGGAYILGSTDQSFPGGFMDEDVVFVTISYRLGILGFLTTGDGVVRGNMGLKDQTAALKWVKENIQFFGGDPNHVTLFGTSAGGASVHQQTLSKLSKGLFQRAVSQSGAASNQWGWIPLKQSLENLKATAEEVNCPKNSNEALVKCLKSKDALELVAAENKLFNSKLSLFSPHLDGLGFVPTTESIDDERAFITEHPLQVVAKGQAHGVPHLIGHTSGEGILATTDFRHDVKNLEKFESEWESRTRQLFQLTPDTPTETVRKIFEFYMPSSLKTNLSPEERIQNYTNLFSDAFFNFDIRETANLQRKFSPVYYYFYTKRYGPSLMSVAFYDVDKSLPKALAIGISVAKFLIRTALGWPIPNYGVDHGEDMFLYFPFPLLDRHGEHYQLSKDHIRMVVDFVKDEKHVVVRGTKFEPLAKEGPLDLFEINDRTRMVREPLEDRLSFLHSLNIRGINGRAK